MHQPLGEFIVEYVRVHALPVQAYDLKTAAATAAAMATKNGWKLMSVTPREIYYQEQEKR